MNEMMKEEAELILLGDYMKLEFIPTLVDNAFTECRYNDEFRRKSKLLHEGNIQELLGFSPEVFAPMGMAGMRFEMTLLKENDPLEDHLIIPLPFQTWMIKLNNQRKAQKALKKINAVKQKWENFGYLNNVSNIKGIMFD
jgi:hypothetical protein